MTEKVAITKSLLDGLANSIAVKSGETLPLTIAEMTDAVDDIILPSGSVNISSNGTHNVTAYETAVVAVPSPPLQASKSYSVSAAGSATIEPDSGYEAMEEVALTIPVAQNVGEDGEEEFYTLNNQRMWRLYAAPVLTAGWVNAGSQSTDWFMYYAVPANTTVTPSTQQQTVGGANYMMEGPITVAAMPAGTAGTPAATKGTVSNHSVTVTPSVTNTAGYISGGTKTGTGVTVSASELISFSTIRTGSSAPSSSLGVDGDIYIQTS